MEISFWVSRYYVNTGIRTSWSETLNRNVQKYTFMLTQADLAGGKWVYFPNVQLDTYLHPQNIHINTQTDPLPVQLICMGSSCILLGNHPDLLTSPHVRIYLFGPLVSGSQTL